MCLRFIWGQIWDRFGTALDSNIFTLAKFSCLVYDNNIPINPHLMKILISSYSFGAGRGSEAGVGWNVASGLAARGHEVWVLSTSEFHADNAPAMQALNLPHFHLLEWDCGLSDFPLAKTYKAWQKRIAPQLRELCAQQHFDLIHHLTFNQYRSVCEVFTSGLPYVCGPLGGAEMVAPVFFADLPFKARLKEMLRYVSWDALPLAWRARRSKQAGLFLASGPQTQARLQGFAQLRGTMLSPIIAVKEEEILTPTPNQQDSSPYLIYAGGLRPEKGPYVMLRALAKLWAAGCRVPLKMAAVPADAKDALIESIRSLGLPEEAVEILPFMPRAELLALMQASRAFLCFNFRDSGCMALLEAVALGAPSICFDNEEQFWLPSDFAYKLATRGKTMPQLEDSLAEAMRHACESPLPNEAWHARRVAWLRRCMTWDARLDYLERCYHHLLSPDEAPLPPFDTTL